MSEINGIMDAPVVYPREAVLTPEQTWQALQISESTYKRSDIPFTRFGKREKRHVWGRVIDWMAEREE